MREENEEKVSVMGKELDAQNNVIIDLKEKLRRNGEVLDEQQRLKSLSKILKSLKLPMKQKKCMLKAFLKKMNNLK